VRFASDPDAQKVRQKYLDGILTDVSIGYIPTEREHDDDIVRVTAYEVLELSAVGIGFDRHAKKRDSMNMEELEARIAELEKLKERSETQTAELEQLRGELKELNTNNDNAEYRAAMLETAMDVGIDKETVERFIEEQKTTEDLLREALKRKTEESTVVTGGERHQEEDMKRDIVDALAVRFGVKSEVDKNVFVGASLQDIGRKLTGYSGYNRTTLFERMMSTSLFPALLMQAGNRTLAKEWDAQDKTFKLFVNEVDVPDFRTNTDITRGAAGGRLDKVPEGGLIKEKYLNENAEEWKLATYGNKFVLTRQMIVNDDLGAFNDMLGDLVFLASNTANGLVYDLLRKKGEFAGYVMSDGKPIFDATHKNILNQAFGDTALSEARRMMRKQKGIDGKTPLNITPRYLIVAPELEQDAAILLNSVSNVNDNKNSGVVNPHYKSLELIVDAELAAADEWYLLGGRRTIKAGYLQGTNRAPILQIDTQSLTATEFAGVFDFGVMAEDYRGMLKGK
jgi:hypothetical protein